MAKNYQDGMHIMLLEDIDPLDWGWAAVLKKSLDTDTFVIDIIGEASPNNSVSTFDLEWSTEVDNPGTPSESLKDPEEVSLIHITSTQAELLERLKEFSFIGDGDVEVQLGNHVRTLPDETEKDFNPYNWIIRMTGEYDGIDGFPLIDPKTNIARAYTRSYRTIYQDSGLSTRVFNIYRTGLPSPLRAGAVGKVSYSRTFDAWVIDALEPRSTSILTTTYF